MIRSLLTEDYSVCYLCGRRAQQEHHIFFGFTGNRKLSEKYKLKVPLCWECHEGNDGVHFNKEKDLALKREGQEVFEAHYPELDFMKIFGRNYIW